LTSDGDFCYTYDNEGNRIEKKSLKSNETVKYEWDHRNRLVKVTTLKETVGYVYDYLNRLVKRNEEFFVHDEWQIICLLKNNKVSHRYLWGANQDELIVADENWTLGDHLNSIRDVIDARGKVTGHRECNAFDKVTRATGKAECVFGYTGKMFDNQTHLQWNINRWYDANVGRWISEDPIGFEGKDTNLVRYVGNHVIYSLDCLGLDYADTGVKRCVGYMKTYGVSIPIHWFLKVGDVGFGMFEENLNPIGTGEIRFDDNETYPEVAPDTLGDDGFYSICYPIAIDNLCYDLDCYKSQVQAYANFDPGMYLGIGNNCNDWIHAASYYAKRTCRLCQSGWGNFINCACEYLYFNERQMLHLEDGNVIFT
jgi:RHS repeat-associated protein